MSAIIDQTLSLIKSGYGERLRDVTIEKVNAGIFMTVVRLSNGFSGIAVTDIDGACGCQQSRIRYFGPFSPGHVNGQKVTDLFEQTEGNVLLDVIKLAAMNAISADIIVHSAYKVVEDTDPVDLLDLGKPENIVIVGAFQSYIKRFAETSHTLSVLELNENALAPEFRKFFVPANRAAETMKKAGIIIITGSTLMNNTLDELLANAPVHATVIVVGPTSSLLPDILFKNNVKIIGATRIADPELAFTMVGEGAAGYHLFKSCAKKICILNEQ